MDISSLVAGSTGGALAAEPAAGAPGMEGGVGVTPETTPEVELKTEQKEERKRRLEEERAEKRQRAEEEREAKRRRVEEEREAKRKRAEEEREEKRRRAEEEREEKRRRAEEEKQEKRRRAEEEKQEKRRRAEEEKEEKRKRVEQEKEEKRKRVEQEKEEKRQRAEQEKEEKRQRAEEEREAKRKAEEEAREAKSRQQPSLTAFFSVAKPAPKSTPPPAPESASLYSKTFLPFFVRESCSVTNKLRLEKQALQASVQSLDLAMYGEQPSMVQQWLASAPPAATTAHVSAREVAAKVNLGASQEEILPLLSLLDTRYIRFYENIRPPYLGLWSRSLPEEYWAERSPFVKQPGLDYDFDSDLEWDVDDEEGEEIGEEDEVLEDEAGDEDVDDFVDANETARRMVLGPLEPVVAREGLAEHGIVLLVPVCSIDPSVDYWKKPRVEKTDTAAPADPASSPAAAASDEPKPVITDSADRSTLCDFIAGNREFTVLTLCEVARRVLPQYSKQVIRNTVDVVAARKKQSGVRVWVLKDSGEPASKHSPSQPTLSQALS